MAKKTEQALKIIASWTPTSGPSASLPGTADLMMLAVPDFEGMNLRIASGRLAIHAAVACDFTVPGAAEKASARVQEIKAALESTGTVHSFSATAGAVPVGTAERLA
jgi:hypothetical protein